MERVVVGFYNNSFWIKNKTNKIQVKKLVVDIDKYKKYDRIKIQTKGRELKKWAIKSDY